MSVRTGRVDQLAGGIFNRLADMLCGEAAAARSEVQPVIDRFVKENFPSESIDLSAESIAEKLGILKPAPRRKVRRLR